MSSKLTFTGDQGATPPAVDIDSFYRLVHQSSKTPINDHVLNCETGLVPDPNANESIPEKHDWNVHSNTFSFSIGCVVPVSTIHAPSLDQITVPQAFYAQPMHLEYPMISELDITITFPAHPSMDVGSFKVVQTVKNVPQAVYGGPCEL